MQFNNYDSYGGILFSFLYVPGEGGQGGNSYFSQLVLILPWEEDGPRRWLSYALTLPQEPSGYDSGTSSTQALAL